MRRFVDLHTHSTFSDGVLSPEELVRRAEGKRLAAIALTDHDTTGGLARARAAAADLPNLQFIPGVEVSAKFPGGTLHILGLGIDEHAGPMSALTERVAASRRQRNPKIIARLQQLGLDITMDDVTATANSRRTEAAEAEIVSRLHIAETLRRKGHVRTTDEGFRRFVGTGAPGFVEKERPAPRRVIAAIRESAGVAVLAHPPQLNYANRAQLERILRDLIGDGLNGLEVYHTDHSPEQVRLYLDLARRFDLAVTGGSDYHGPAGAEAALGRPRVPVAAVAGELAERYLART